MEVRLHVCSCRFFAAPDFPGSPGLGAWRALPSGGDEGDRHVVACRPGRSGQQTGGGKAGRQAGVSMQRTCKAREFTRLGAVSAV